MKDVIFIGNRLHVLLVLLERKEKYRVVKAFVLENSPLHREINGLQVPYQLFNDTKEDRSALLHFLTTAKFDLLISNGNPFILPVSALSATHPGAVFINTHPAYLPHLKGKTPLNGVFYLNYSYIGATTHYMNDGVDTGNIIYQEKTNIGDDIDQGLVYFLSFKLEGAVFARALNILEQHDFSYHGTLQSRKGSYFSRKEETFVIDFSKDDDETIIKKVRSVGIPTQGIGINAGSSAYRVFEAEKIVNPYLLGLFADAQPGSALLVYSNKLLVKTNQGIIKFSYVQP